MLKLRVAVCLLAGLLVQPPRPAGADLMEEVRAGNRAALESIDTLHCVVTKSVLVSSVIPPRNATGEYWTSGNSSRVRMRDIRGITELVVNDSVARSIAAFRDRKGKEQIRFSIMRMEPGQPHGECDPWVRGLLKLCGPKGRPLTLDELLAKPHKLKSVNHQSVEGLEYVVVSLSLELMPGQHGDFEIWFDPRVNYLAKRLTGTWSPEGTLKRRESNVVSFKEILPAVFFPERVETRHYDGEKLVNHEVVEFSEIEINRPIPADMFVVSVPPGAKVYDAIEGIEYQVDSRGERVGAARPIPRVAPLPVGAKQATASTEELRPWSRSVFLWSLALFVIGGAVWFIRRVRQANAA